MMVLPKSYNLKPDKSAYTTKLISGLLHIGIFAVMIVWQNNMQAPRIILPQSQIIALQFTPDDIAKVRAVKIAPQKQSPPQTKPNKMQAKSNNVNPIKTVASSAKPINYTQKSVVSTPTNIAPSAQPHDTESVGIKSQQAAYVPPQFNAAHLNNPPPAYPSIARRRGWQGRVLLNVHICEQGKARHVMVSKSSGYAILDKAAKQAVQNWRFIPARKGDMQVASNVIVPINFKLN